MGLTDQPSASGSVPWQKGSDILALFTDGIVDSRNAAGDRLGEASVLDTIISNRAKQPAEIVSSVFELLENYSGEIPSPDDLTLLVLRT
jgi:sigma-B regulation protein RsbU (phosphoserine phosphatase)